MQFKHQDNAKYKDIFLIYFIKYELLTDIYPLEDSTMLTRLRVE